MKTAFDGVFAGKTVLVTGHTGFKGSWLSLWLQELGANVVGFALPPEAEPSLFSQLGLARLIDSRLGDIREAALVRQVFEETRPEIVFHLAAQPLVRLSYEFPVETFSVNVVGTANVLDAVRVTDSVRVCQVITTDKCYENLEADYAYREDDRLGGRDPYSASKACAELVVASYRASFFSGPGAASISSTRAGNVIGGGDWAKDRLVPDCARALAAGQPIPVRSPRSVRPWQYVLEPLSGYLRLASRQWAEPMAYAEAWNFGPKLGTARSVGEIADHVVRSWGSGRWLNLSADSSVPHEAGLLQVDSAKAAKRLQWQPVYELHEGIQKTMDWYRASQQPGFEALEMTRTQLARFTAAAAKAGLPWAGEESTEAAAMAASL